MLLRMKKALSEIPVVAYWGSDGEEDPPADPPADGGAGKTPEPEATTTPPSDDGDTFSRDYVEKLRKEAADNRKRAQAAEAELQKKADADLSDMEKMTTRAESAETANVAGSAALREERIANAVLRVAHDLNFHDPADARGALILDDIDFDDNGRPDETQIKTQLQKVAKEKPYLISTTVTGSGDGAPTGDPVTPPDEFQASVDKHKEEFEKQGFVPIPTS